MNIEHFIAQRSPRWDELERLLIDAERSEDWHLGRRRLQELVHLYRETCSDLNRARSHTANPQILERLNGLSGRAYRLIYAGASSDSGVRSLRKLFLRDIPYTFRLERNTVARAALAMVLGAAVGFLAVIWDPTNGERLIPAMFFTESPRERVEKIERSEESIENLSEAAAFGAQLYTHNIRVSFLAFSLGAISIIGAYLILFYNGVILGSVAAMYYLDRVQLFFFAWVGPHGALELPAIVFGAAAGIRLGNAMLLPGDLSRAASVRRAFPVVWRMMVATVVTLICAGLIEGSFSQFSGKSFPYVLKIGVALTLFVALVVYLFARRVGSEADS